MIIRPILLLAAVAALAFCADAPAADFAFEIRCEQQYTDAELADLIWSQGTTPLIAARTYERGKAVPPREDVTVQMMIAPSATSRYWAAVTNQATNATSYLLQWPTIGTNTTADAPWYYVLYFLRDGRRYWTGSGNLWIEETSATGDGLVWQEITSIDLAGLTNDIQRISDFALDMDNLRGELQGPAWLTPARFEWTAQETTVVVTNTGDVEDNNWSVLTRKRIVETTPEYEIRPEILRNQWDEEMEASLDGPGTLEPVGDGSYILHWYLGAEIGSTATVTGQLGDWRESLTVTKTAGGSTGTQELFVANSPGSVREPLTTVFETWTNSPYAGWGFRFAHYGEAAFTNWEMRTNGITLAEHSWMGAADLSGVSYVADAPQPYYRPATLVASNLAYGAAHFSQAVGTRLAWMGKDGQPHASTIVDQRRMNYDLCLSKISPPLDPEVVTAYPILEPREANSKIAVGDKTVDLPNIGFLAMAQLQRGWICGGKARRFSGGMYGIFDPDTGKYIKDSRAQAVGGDSGHPVFVSTDGEHLVLYGAWWRPNEISLPGDDIGKPLILQAAAAMGADPDAIQWETWDEWPTYLGPGLIMGENNYSGSEDAEGEGE